MDKVNFRILTYNSTGFADDKKEFIVDIINKYSPDIVFIQETWLLPSRRNAALRSLHKSYLADGISSVSDEELLLGRPYGGLGILWRKSMAASVRFRTITNTSRACAIEVETHNGTMTLINTYMPVDTQRKNAVSDEFLDTMDKIETFIESCSSSKVVVAGDLNVDFVRGNAHDKYMKDFMERWNIVDSFDLSVANKGYTYYDLSSGAKSCIDHFLVHHSLCDSVLKVSRCEHALNPSKHLPVIMDILEEKKTINVNDNGVMRTQPPISWNRVNEEHVKQYQEKQCEYLANLPEYDVLECVNLRCENTNHKRDIDELCSHLLDCCLVADHVFPRVTKNTRRPEWTVDVKPFRDDALMWHNLWKQTGCPSDGMVFDNMRESKRQYAYANRRNRR